MTRLVEKLCHWVQLWYAIFVMSAIVVVLVGMSYLFAPRGAASFYVTIFNAAFIVPTLIGSYLLLKRCRSRRE